MGTAHPKKRAFEPVGPDAPPHPDETERQERKPMAVALDEGHRTESHVPTTQSLDAFDAEVARKNADPNLEKLRGTSDQGS